MTLFRCSVNYADDLGMSEEEPEEWPTVTKKKAKSVVSRKSDSTAAKRGNNFVFLFSFDFLVSVKASVFLAFFYCHV